MVLVLRKSDLKVISASSKKVKFYESIYTVPLDEKMPSAEDIAETVELSELKWLEENEVHEGPKQKSPPKPALPKHVLAVKSLHEFSTPIEVNEDRVQSEIEKSASTHRDDSGEGDYVPEHATHSVDRLVSELVEELQERIAKGVDKPNLRKRVMAKLTAGKVLMLNDSIAPGQLKKGKKQKPGAINADNVVSGKRVPKSNQLSSAKPKPNKKSSKGKAATGYLSFYKTICETADEVGCCW